jgi:hypothetical protein
MTSTIKVNKIEKESGSTLTIGGACTAVTLACGATQSGFGTPSSSVLWCTTAKTSPFTAADKVGYFVNTTGGVVTVTLPSSPSAGDVVAIKDYADTFNSNNVTIGRNGSKIAGSCLDATLNTNGDSITLVYVDGTQGWVNVNTDDTVAGASYIAATGGTVTTVDTNFKVHTFTSSGCFQVTAVGNPAGSSTVSYMVVAGGGGSVNDRGGAGGAGGFREGTCSSDPYSPDKSPLATTSLPVSVQTYPITIGAGGAANDSPPLTKGSNGANSVFSSITSAGGGGGGRTPTAGGDGGSGGGGGCAAGSGNTPPVSPPQGNDGGTATPSSPPVGNGAGGGATAAGSPAPGPTVGGAGGAGATTSINGSATAFAGGGGGGSDAPGKGLGGAGGGGNGGAGPYPGSSVAAQAGTANTGGGAGGANGGGPSGTGVAGGSGIVIIRYKFQ